MPNHIHPKHHTRHLSSLLIVLLVLSYHTECCVSLHGESRDIMDARQMLNSQQNIASCLRRSLQKGEIRLARDIMGLYDSKYEQSMIQVYQKQLLRLKEISQEIVLSQNAVQPVVKWGQNYTHLFISMKMSHRWDSPPCLNTKQQVTNLINNTFNYTNLCHVSHQKIKFTFVLQLFGGVKGENAQVIRDGVGVYSTILEKVESDVWAFLGKDEKVYQIWGQIAQRYGQVNKIYQGKLQDALNIKKSKPVQMGKGKRNRSKQEEQEEQDKGVENNNEVQGQEAGNSQIVVQNTQADQTQQSWHSDQIEAAVVQDISLPQQNQQL